MESRRFRPRDAFSPRRGCLVALLGAAVALTVIATLSGVMPASAATGREVVFYSPHPDDETLSLGVLIAAHVVAGRTVHVVLLSDGRDSEAFTSINARLVAEHRRPLTRDQFAAARVRDFRASCAKLGVPAANVHFENIPGDLTVENTTPVFVKYHRLFPRAGHYTMTWTDPFTSHGYVGEALRELHEDDPEDYPDVRWGVSRLEWGTPAVRAVRPWTARPTAQVKAMVLAAAAQYGIWDPVHARYRTGYYSVGDQFAALRADVRNVLHGPPPD